MKRYKTILIDPPWKYGKGWKTGGAGLRYSLMSLEEIMKLPIENLSQKNSHLYLWTPNSLVPSALSVMKVWGFKFKTILSWAKERSIFGYYFKGQTEQLLFGVRGKLGPKDRHQTTLLKGKNIIHSKKPIMSYEVIKKVSTPPRVELFARNKRKGWSVWGNEVKSDFKIEDYK